MAISSPLHQNGAYIDITAVKAKSLAVRTNSVLTTAYEHGPRIEKGPELAEQLNEETKNKYVKGRCV